MTEQEKREKPIEEMKNAIREVLSENPKIGWIPGLAEPLLSKIEALGYRKEEEVRKEKAKEILQEIASPYYSVGDGYELTRRDIQKLAEKFGVEVDE